jgi:hypothetical protein
MKSLAEVFFEGLEASCWKNDKTRWYAVTTDDSVVCPERDAYETFSELVFCTAGRSS